MPVGMLSASVRIRTASHVADDVLSRTVGATRHTEHVTSQIRCTGILCRALVTASASTQDVVLRSSTSRLTDDMMRHQTRGNHSCVLVASMSLSLPVLARTALRLSRCSARNRESPPVAYVQHGSTLHGLPSKLGGSYGPVVLTLCCVVRPDNENTTGRAGRRQEVCQKIFHMCSDLRCYPDTTSVRRLVGVSAEALSYHVLRATQLLVSP
jgi:hypothetical protein